MPNKDLRSFLQNAYAQHEVAEVDKEINPKFQLTAVLERLEKENRYPAVLFNMSLDHQCQYLVTFLRVGSD
jgi:UbiD family decarboxylase